MECKRLCVVVVDDIIINKKWLFAEGVRRVFDES